MKDLLCFLLLISTYHTSIGQVHQALYLWPGSVPGETAAKAAPVISDNDKGDVIRIEKVTNPALIVYEPDPSVHNGASVVICPGGGYHILAIDLEGYEIAEWLSSLGYTAFVLQYRVPDNRLGALQDVQRAIRTVRGRADEWGLHKDKVGVLGFSAGGSLSARASTLYASRIYDSVDAYDALSARPDFSILIYPAYLDQGPGNSLTPELSVNAETPPMFLFVAFDDARFVNSSLVMASALRLAGIPFELHVLPEGGHGFGMRAGKRAPETWPKQCEKWLAEFIIK